MSRRVSSTAPTALRRDLFSRNLPSRLSHPADFRAISPRRINNLRRFLSVNFLLTPTASFTSAHRVKKQGREHFRIVRIPSSGSRLLTLDSQLPAPLSTFRFTRLSTSRPQVYLESYAYEKMPCFSSTLTLRAANTGLTSLDRRALVEISQQRIVQPCVLSGVI